MSRNPSLIVPFVVLVWFMVMLLVSWLGGWAELARVYRTTQPFEGTKWRFQSAQMRWRVNYNHPLSIGANAEGLYLSILFLFRVGHPPLFIPWRDISIWPMKYLWFTVYQFSFRQVPSVPLRVRGALGKKIEAAAGAAWPGDRGTSDAAF